MAKGPVGADGAPRGPGTSCWKREEASEAAEGGWGRGACAGPLPVLGVYHPRWLCSGWEEAARGVGRWTIGWVWGRSRARGPVSAGYVPVRPRAEIPPLASASACLQLTLPGRRRTTAPPPRVPHLHNPTPAPLGVLGNWGPQQRAKHRPA